MAIPAIGPRALPGTYQFLFLGRLFSRVRRNGVDEAAVSLTCKHHVASAALGDNRCCKNVGLMRSNGEVVMSDDEATQRLLAWEAAGEAINQEAHVKLGRHFLADFA